MRLPVGLQHLFNRAGPRSLTATKATFRVRQYAAACSYSSSSAATKSITIDGKEYQTDEWFNTPSTITGAIGRRLHLEPAHPISITRQLIESRFPGFQSHNDLFPVVSVKQNFDSLGFPADHPGRNRSDTYYINKETVLRTHTSAHQVDIFNANTSPGYLITADVYRRDAVDRSHYPIFHQMEGAMTWDRNDLQGHKSLADLIWSDVAKLPKHDMKVLDPNPTSHPERNPLQQEHNADEVEAIATHLKRSLENVVVEIFTQARKAAAKLNAQNGTSTNPEDDAPLHVRWVEAYFPFTSPSWELEVEWRGEWLEVLGCGVVQQPVLNNAGVLSRLGWAFGVGIERIAMLLFSIPDIRLFWSKDPRFLNQFKQPDPAKIAPTVSELDRDWGISRFLPFSKYPAAERDVSFWLPGTVESSSAPSAAGGLVTPANSTQVHENDVMEIVRQLAGDVVENVALVDEFVHPKKKRKSMCYRIVYRSLERTLTGDEVQELHKKIGDRLVEQLGVELR
ncbi:mitochondrial phenylalanyl-tRNA synthetase [Phyllosticta capitalensis]